MCTVSCGIEMLPALWVAELCAPGGVRCVSQCTFFGIPLAIQVDTKQVYTELVLITYTVSELTPSHSSQFRNF